MNFKDARKQNLFARINEVRLEHEPLEVIVEVDERQKHRVAREMDKMGEVIHVFKHIPYIASVFDPADA